MKSEHIISKKKDEIEYPCLMKSTANEDLVVLFIADKIGTALTKSTIYYIGEHRKDWTTNVFEPLDSNDKIILQND